MVPAPLNAGFSFPEISRTTWRKRFLLWFKPMQKSTDGATTIYFKWLKGEMYVIDIITKFL